MNVGLRQAQPSAASSALGGKLSPRNKPSSEFGSRCTLWDVVTEVTTQEARSIWRDDQPTTEQITQPEG
ncbi:MAG: hypothetical protein RMK91_05390 [Pseudanabaenaceae cyanobacterium SKYGB_i_bin29]|nr:hypothetical protein [Pseudanabaenaceae cyanobacterium SKYG29]MDW8421282.1 hypothetical protein [Pseudanabaenaceae cyanobacterium SKYGB_i_bin29]